MGASKGGGGGAIDWLTEIDDILRRSHDTLKGIRDDVKNLDPRVITDDITVRSNVPKKSFQLEMSKLVPVQDGPSRVVREVPYDGRVDGYVIGFPDGADQAVGIRLEDNETGEKFFPRNPEDQWFAANNYTDSIDLSFEVEEGQELATIYLNNTQKTHFINSMPTIKSKEQSEVIKR